MPSDPIADKPLYPSNNQYGIPSLRYTPLTGVPDWLITTFTVRWYRYHDAEITDATSTPRYGSCVSPTSQSIKIINVRQLVNNKKEVTLTCGDKVRHSGEVYTPPLSIQNPR